MNYKTIRSDRKTVALQVKDGQLIVRAPCRMRDADIEKFVSDNSAWIEKQLKKIADIPKLPPLSPEELQALTNRAAELIPPRVKHYASLMGVSYGRITVRHQRTRWGSCSSKGNLNFNCLLLLAPTEALDSVIVHELCHRKQMNHSDLFYSEVLRVFPEYHKWTAWLKQNGAALISRLPQK